MPLNPNTPISYLITDGRTHPETTAASPEFTRLLAFVGAGVGARVSLIQLREKLLRPRLLYELTAQAVALTKGSPTRLLVNDRADIALAAGADGVHLTTRSLDAALIRRISKSNFLIGVSTHSLAEARAARAAGADFAVFGPVFDTPSKRIYGAPLGLDQLREAAHTLAPFPLLALGGLTLENARDAIGAGARGVAAVRLFSEAQRLDWIVSQLVSTSPANHC